MKTDLSLSKANAAASGPNAKCRTPPPPYKPQPRQTVAQGKQAFAAAISPQRVKPSIAPRVNRPEAILKTAQPAKVTGVVNRAMPARAQASSRILQTKGTANHKDASQSARRPAPAVYRPQAKPVSLQAKKGGGLNGHQHDPSIQTLPMVLQIKKTHREEAHGGQRQRQVTHPLNRIGTRPVAPHSVLQPKRLKRHLSPGNVLQMAANVCPACGWGYRFGTLVCPRCGGVLQGQAPAAPMAPVPAPLAGGGAAPPAPALAAPALVIAGAPLPAAAPMIVHPLYREMVLTDADEGATRGAIHAHNHFVGELYRIGRVGFHAPQPAATVANVINTIKTSMGGGGGDHGRGIKAKVDQVVNDANAAGYDITDARVQSALESIANALGSLGGTQIGEFKGTWRGGGFNDK